MTTLARPRSKMKTRDKVKYGFAGLLAIMTVVAIGGLMLARHHRHQTTLQEDLQVKQAISVYGKAGALPEKVELPEEPVSNGIIAR